MPGNVLPASTVMPTLADPLTGALGASMRFSQDNLVPPSSYDSGIPLSLDTLDWGNVDTGIQNVNSQENEWSSGDSDVLSNINFAAADMWGRGDTALQ
ncbi:hypothetical protein SEPCBS57363_005428 [Sporothrix epigloea]|uniref:Uncharacterized protein n=1 Tax=Sporothrix epigloea TaxID=1892477 RepID=A0ABP0DZR8_9PEZI